MVVRKTHRRVFISVLLIFSLLIASYFAFATETAETKQGAKRYNWLICVANYKNNCVNSICLNSNERHCNSFCLQASVHKCKVESQEAAGVRFY